MSDCGSTRGICALGMLCLTLAGCGIFMSPTKAAWAHAEGQCERDLRGCQRACDQAVAANSDRTTCKVLSIMWAEQDPAYLQAKPSHRLDMMSPQHIIDLRDFADEVCRDGIQRACSARDGLGAYIAASTKATATSVAVDAPAPEAKPESPLDKAKATLEEALTIMDDLFGCRTPGGRCKHSIPRRIRPQLMLAESSVKRGSADAAQNAADLLAAVKVVQATWEAEDRAARAAAREKADWTEARDQCVESASDCAKQCTAKPGSNYCVYVAAQLFEGEGVARDRKRAYSLGPHAMRAGRTDAERSTCSSSRSGPST